MAGSLLGVAVDVRLLGLVGVDCCDDEVKALVSEVLYDGNVKVDDVDKPVQRTQRDCWMS